MNPQKSRARPLSPEERRSAILDAVIPLLVERGAAVTTAEMAEAAGIAEGTIFRVFPDKASLLHAAIETTMDPRPIENALADIDAGLPMDKQLAEAARILGARYENTTALVAMVRSMPHEATHHERAHAVASEAMASVVRSLTILLERYRPLLRVEPTRAASLLRGLVFTESHHLLASDGPMTAEELVDVLLNGITTGTR